MKNLPSYKASGSDQSSGGKKVNVKWSCIQDVLNTKKTEYADELALGFKRKSGIRNIPQVNSDMGNPQWLSGKESTCNQGNAGLIPRWEIPWRRKWHSTPVFLSRQSQGQRSPGGCKRVECDLVSKWQQRNSDMLKR